MLSIDTIYNLLPTPPDDHTYELEQQSPQIIAIWLIHPDKYNYTTEPVRTIHSFIKNRNVHAPLNHKKPRASVLCPVTQLYTLNPFTAIVPKYTTLINQ